MVNLKEVEKDLYDVESRRMTEEQYLANRKHQNKIAPPQPTNYPDARKHQIVSFVKSGIRIAGYLLLAVDQLVACAVVLILSEAVGIYEELV
jgi:hypothetical protein